MATAAEICVAALKKSGIIGYGQSPTEELPDALADLGDMLALWNEKRWLIWHLLEFGLVSTGQQIPYTIGPGGQFNMNPRPSRIEAAFLRQLTGSGNFVGGLPVDTPLIVISSWEEYSRIALKSLVSFPKYVFLDTATPIANLKIYPYPRPSQYEIHILVKDVFPTTLTAPTSFANYPRMTIPGMKFNLARWLRQAYGKGRSPDTELNNLAEDALETIRNAQTQLPDLQMPRMLIASGAGYNIFSDQQW